MSGRPSTSSSLNQNRRSLLQSPLRLLRFPIIYRYVFKEIASTFLLAVVVFTAVLFLARSLRLVELIINKNVPLSDILTLFSYVIPGFLEIAIPMSLLLGVLLSFSRLSSDSELVVMRSAGVSFYQLAKPVLAFALLAFLATGGISLWLRPWSNHQLARGLFEIARVKASAGLTAGVFNEFGPLTIYAESVDDQSGKLQNVLISDRRSADISRNFIAKYGVIVSDPEERSLSLQLYQGSIQEGSGLNFNVTTFEVNSLKLPQSELLDTTEEKDGKKASEMFLNELNSALADPNLSTAKDPLKSARYRVELHRRFSLPASVFCVALAAMALGVQPSRSGKSWGTTANIGLGIGMILFYYLLLAFCSALASYDYAPAWILLWIPNVIISVLGIFLFRQVGTERWQAVGQAFSEFTAFWRKQLRV